VAELTNRLVRGSELVRERRRKGGHRSPSEEERTEDRGSSGSGGGLLKLSESNSDNFTGSTSREFDLPSPVYLKIL